MKKDQLEQQWITLILEAKKIDLTVEEVQTFYMINLWQIRSINKQLRPKHTFLHSPILHSIYIFHGAQFFRHKRLISSYI